MALTQADPSRVVVARVNLAIMLALGLLVGIAAGFVWAGHRASDRVEACQRVIAHGAYYLDPGFDPSYSDNDRHGDQDVCIGHD